MKFQSRISTIVTLNAIAASGTFFIAWLICIGSTAALFVSAPFVSDRTESQISRLISPSVKTTTVSLAWASISAIVRMRLFNDNNEDKNESPALLADEQLTQEVVSSDNSDQEKTFTFVYLESGDLSGLYVWNQNHSYPGLTLIFREGSSASETRVLLEYFQVQQISDLVGKSFRSRWESALCAWHELEDKMAAYSQSCQYASAEYDIKSCAGCRHWNGDTSFGRLLVCGYHPYGNENCPDYES